LALTQIRKIIIAIDENKKENEKILKWIDNDIDEYINKYYPFIDPEKKYPFIIEKLAQLKEEIYLKKPTKTNAVEEIPKVIWNGSINTLVYIFKQLREINPPGSNKSFIETKSKDALAEFILKNFVDPKSNSFNKGTILKYLNPGANDKVPTGKGKHIKVELSQVELSQS
jgi:hypothetical protein